MLTSHEIFHLNPCDGFSVYREEAQTLGGLEELILLNFRHQVTGGIMPILVTKRTAYMMASMIQSVGGLDFPQGAN